MEYRERKIVKLICVSCRHTFSSCKYLYKHYKPFTDHYSKKLDPFISCKEAADEFCTKTSAPNTGNPDLESFFSGRLSKEELLEFALPQVARKSKI